MQLKTLINQQKGNNTGLGSLKSFFDDLGDFTRNNANLVSGIPILGQVAAVGAGISQQNVNRNAEQKQQEEYSKYLQAQQNTAVAKEITTKNTFFEDNKEIIIVSVLGIVIITVVVIKSKNKKDKNFKNNKNQKR